MSGALVENFNMGIFLRKRIQLHFTTLRSRSDAYKSELISNFKKDILPHFSTNKLKLIIDHKHVIDWQDEQAHEAF